MKLAALLLALAAARAQSPRLGGCAVFPPDNIWNQPVDTLPVDRNSAAFVNSVGADRTLFADFGPGGAGIPYAIVPGSQPKVPISFEYDDESEAGPYPIPPGAPIEGGPSSRGDRHILVLDRDNCVLYELFSAYPQADGSWKAGSGAIFPLNGNKLRPLGWTSADAAGYAILPGLVRYDEVASGEIRHAVRFTVPRTRRAYVWPATHYASSLTDPALPPMGQRFRLRADFDITGFSPEIQVILKALKKYGMMLADNGTQWFITGAPDDRWNNDRLRELRRVRGSDLEAVDSTPLMIDPASGETRAGTRVAGVVNAASYRPGWVAPEEIVTILGATGTRVLFDGTPAPWVAAGPAQISAAAPADVAGKAVTEIVVENQGQRVFSAIVAVAAAAPGIFALDASGRGPGAILNQDWSVNSAANPSAKDGVIQIFGTGGGDAVRIGGLAAEVLYAGPVPGVAGLWQVNARVPASVAAGGRISVLVIAAGRSSQPDVTVAVE